MASTPILDILLTYFDASFKEAVQSNKLRQLSLPNVKFVNPNRSKNTLKFWEDLELKGQNEGIKIKFKTRVID